MSLENSQAIITARALTRIYSVGNTKVIGIKDVDLEIAEGEIVVIKGNSGSGKSTLLSLLAGLDRATQGELIVADHELNHGNDTDLTYFRREVVGMVFQSFNLLPTLNVLENACLPALLAGKVLSQSQHKAIEILDWLGLKARLYHLPAQLSGGEMQRTAIARALVNDPDLIIADEPTGNLDSKTGSRILDFIKDLNRNIGRTVIVATHSTDADAMAHRILNLEDGRIIQAT